MTEVNRNDEFLKILGAHRARYPLMQPQDYVKLAFQNTFGAEHMVASESMALASLLREWRGLESDRAYCENIGNGLSRFYLSGFNAESAAPLLAHLFAQTAANHTGTDAEFYAKLRLLEQLHVSGTADFLQSYKSAGCPAVHHSDIYRDAYHPHYRVILSRYAYSFSVTLAIDTLLKSGKPIIVAIDGRCGSGKSTLASVIADVFHCNVFHTDDFYLPKSERDANWRQVPAGNMDLCRFLDEVLEPARRGKTIEYRAYDCTGGAFRASKLYSPGKLTVIEGSYSLYPELCGYYDLSVFLTCDRESQKQRLIKRELDYFPEFERVWIPLEEQYFAAFHIEEHANLVLDTSCHFTEN